MALRKRQETACSENRRDALRRVRGFTAEVLRENRPRQAVLAKSNSQVHRRLNGDVYKSRCTSERCCTR